jgi:hypothetical protein
MLLISLNGQDLLRFKRLAAYLKRQAIPKDRMSCLSPAF